VTKWLTFQAEVELAAELARRRRILAAARTSHGWPQPRALDVSRTSSRRPRSGLAVELATPTERISRRSGGGDAQRRRGRRRIEEDGRRLAEEKGAATHRGWGQHWWRMGAAAR
jgi:hypothetical protein